MLQVVWFKKDLRVQDHAPLAAAARAGAVLPIYVYEPEIIASPDYAPQHHAFINECLTELAFDLYKLGSPLVTLRGEITQTLQSIKFALGPFRLHSFEETGNDISFQRDRRVVQWCKDENIEWLEYPCNGVVRRLKSRDDWSGIWHQRMTAPLTPTPACLEKPPQHIQSKGILDARACGLTGEDKPDRQRGGRKAALQRLDEFIEHALAGYRYAMSSPLTAADACSRLSPHLTFGSLSMRELVQRVWQLRSEIIGNPANDSLLKSLKSWESRLHWRCHFIQKLEDQPRIEFDNMHSAYDAVRQDLNREHFEAWAAGESGYPLVDACMKMLKATGWINFRMRAMLVSFSSYQLWNPWREPALHLAREFLDYEPGIHFPQIQMQSGTTGINIIRIYNPVKQSIDQDRGGIFLRRWLPALRGVAPEFLHEPWRAPQLPAGYPAPIVDHIEAARLARETLWAQRATPTARAESKQVLTKHGSRAKAPRKRAAASSQMSFEF